jgi:nucleoside-diphosphate-sugar epimerase
MAATFSLAGKRVYVAGHRGMVGAALVRRLAGERCEVLSATRAELDLTDPAATRAWMKRHRPDIVFHAAAKVGGIAYNNAYPVEFLADNIAIAVNVIQAAHEAGVSKLLFLGSSCIYPRLAPQPMREDLLWIRQDFLLHEGAFEKFIVHGHTPVKEVEVHPNRINLDTGAYATGRLACLVLQDDARAFI